MTDPSGAAVASAQVTARNAGTHFARTVRTNPRGEDRLEFMPVGSYAVEVTAGTNVLHASPIKGLSGRVLRRAEGLLPPSGLSAG